MKGHDMINHNSKTIPADVLALIASYKKNGGKIHRAKPRKVRKTDVWSLSLRMLNGSKGHTYVK